MQLCKYSIILMALGQFLLMPHLASYGSQKPLFIFFLVLVSGALYCLFESGAISYWEMAFMMSILIQDEFGLGCHFACISPFS